MLRYGFMTLGVLAVLAALAGVKGAQISSLISSAKAFEAAGPPPDIVGAAKAKEQAWEATITAVGTTVSAKGVTISTEVPGTVSRLYFESGRTVKQGVPLVELDSSVERAELAALRARMQHAELTLHRSQELARSQAIPSAQLDADTATYDSLKAEGEALAAQIAKKTLRAPFSGRLGIRHVNLGQYLTPGTAVVDLESTESLFVDFMLPQHQLSGLAIGMPVRVQLDGDRDRVISGKISAIDSAVDAATRSARVRAELPRAEHPDLRPGAFATVAVVLPEAPRVVSVPVTAVQRASYGDSVFLLEDSGTPAKTTSDGKPIRRARQQFVRLGGQRGDFISVLEGVQAGQEVVVAGAFKLRNGGAVVVDNTVQPKADLSPRPTAR